MYSHSFSISALPTIFQASSCIHNYYRALSVNQFKRVYSQTIPLISYFTDSTSLEVLYQLYQDEDLVVVQILSSFIERLLGDLFMFKVKDSLLVNTPKESLPDCPRMMKDLLVTKELEAVFGEDFLFLLHIFLGPPTGLNLRNVTWHGFVLQGEFPWIYVAFLFVLLFTIPSFIPNSERLKRPQLNFNEFSPSHFETNQGIYIFDTENIKNEDILVLENLFENTYFCLPKRSHNLKKGLKEFLNGFYALSLCHFLPQLEHSLRRLFVIFNKITPNALTAQSRVLYTTLDVFLDANVEESFTNGRLLSNKIPSEVGFNLFEMLLDLFIHADGLRLRDKISHCEVDFSTIPRIAVDRVLGVMVTLCAIYSYYPIKENSLVSHCLQFCKEYTSCFHPRACLYREVRETSVAWFELLDFYQFQLKDQEEVDQVEEDSLNWIYIKKNDMSEEDFGKLEVIEAYFVNLLSNIQDESDQRVHSLFFEKDAIKKFPRLATLFQSPVQLSRILSLRKSTKILTSIIKGFQIKVKELQQAVLQKSAGRRQEDSLYKLLGLLKYFLQVMKLFGIISEWFLWTNPPVGEKDKFVTNFLVMMEKIYTKFGENHWNIMIEIIKKYVDEIELQFFKQKRTKK